MECKECFKCRRSFPLSEFYRHPQMADGHLGKCKQCTKADVQSNYSRNRERYRLYEKARAKTERRKEWTSKRQQRIRRQEPEKYKARSAVGNAIRDGRLTRKPCEVCGIQPAHAHHDDYSKPLDVRWLCVQHHHELHQQEKRLQAS